MRVYSNTRIKQRVGNQDDVLINKLEQNVAADDGFKFIDNLSLRVSIMHQACQFDEFSNLDLDDSDRNFLSNSVSILSFLQETLVENVKLKDLSKSESYNKYAQHIEILEKILSNYLALMYSYGYEDMITMISKWWTNKDAVLLKNIHKLPSSIEIYYDGIFSKFDLSIFEALSQNNIECILFVHTDSWFQKSILRLGDYGDLEQDKIYKINIGKKSIECLSDFSPEYNIEVNTVPMSSLYGPYIERKIDELISNGADYGEIGVVCADDTDVRDLSIFLEDTKNIIVRSESSIKNSDTYKTYSLILEMLQNEESISDFFNSNIKNIYVSTLNRFIENNVLSRDDVSFIFSNLHSDDPSVYIESLLSSIQSSFERFNIDESTGAMNEVFELFHNYKDFLFKLNMESILSIILNTIGEYKDTFRLSDEEDKVVVCDFLNSRGLSRKYLIFTGFKRGVVPIAIKKDRFIDFETRELVGMPTSSDRTAMQYHYWQSLISKSDKTFIVYNSSENAEIADFIKRIDGVEYKEYDSSVLFDDVFYQSEVSFDGIEFDIKSVVQQDRILTPSSLKDYLSCKRKYYFKYIKKIKEPTSFSFKTENRDIGILVHSILEKSLSLLKEGSSINVVFELIESELKTGLPKTSSYSYNFLFWKEKLNQYILKEQVSINDIEFVEQKLQAKYGPILLSGIIDRMDYINSYIISDYKTGRIPLLKKTGKGEVDFQPEFYKLLVKANYQYEDISFVYRDVKNIEIVPVEFNENREKAFYDALDSFINDDGVYSMTSKVETCRYCPYKSFCGRN